MPQKFVQSLLRQDERVINVTRQHWLVLLRSLFVEVTLILIIAAVALGLSVLFPLFLTGFGLAIALLLLLIPFIGGVIETLTWWNRQYIVTNERVIHISGLFTKQVKDASLERINDVKMDQSAVGRLFNYGDVRLLTTNQLGNNPFRMLNDPARFTSALLNIQGDGRESSSQQFKR
jgi:uncharacterized membrane protein YdbT with pleckstrin-like domain